jgi:hypothetical protein
MLHDSDWQEITLGYWKFEGVRKAHNVKMRNASLWFSRNSPVFCWNLLPPRTMKIKTASYSEMLVNFYQTRWHHTPEGSIFNNHHCQDFHFMWRIFVDWLERRRTEMFMLLYNINQQCTFSKLIVYVFYMFLNLRVHLQEDGCICGYGIVCLHDSGISSLLEVCVRQCWVHTSTCGLIILSACKTYCTIPVYTAIFLRMNPRVWNVEDIIN